MRRFYSKGSLRDVIYGVRVCVLVYVNFLVGLVSKWRVLGVVDVTKYGRQILEVCTNTES